MQESIGKLIEASKALKKAKWAVEDVALTVNCIDTQDTEQEEAKRQVEWALEDIIRELRDVHNDMKTLLTAIAK